MTENIEIYLRVFTLIFLALGTFIGYKNYKELKRKNEVDESPYLGFVEYESSYCVVKNYGKTPFKIKKIEFLKGEEVFETLKDEGINKKYFRYIMPTEKREIKYKINYQVELDTSLNGDYIIIKVYFSNHIKEESNEMTLNIKCNLMTIG